MPKLGVLMLISPAHLQKWFGLNPTTIAHVGAHTAEESAAYSELGWNTVTWFEANPLMVQKLRDMKELIGQDIVEGAVSKETGNIIDFYIASNSLSSSIFQFLDHSQVYPGISTTQKIQQRTIALDDYFAEKRAPDLINLDIQGAELAALQGAEKILKATSWIYCEVNFRELYSGGASISQLDSWLELNNFKRIATRRQFGEGWGDALYRNTNLTNFTPFEFLAEIYFKVNWDLSQFIYRSRLLANKIKLCFLRKTK